MKVGEKRERERETERDREKQPRKQTLNYREQTAGCWARGEWEGLSE